MAQYPNLANCEVPNYPCPNYEEVAHMSSDEDDSGSFVLDGFMYDDHGELVPVCEEGAPTSQSTTTPICPPPSSPPPFTPATKPGQTPVLPKPSSISGRREITVTKDSNGKLGIKLTRMGPRIFFSYVGKNSNAAKFGLGFGDQLLEVKGLDITKFSGTKLMQVMSSPTLKVFQMTVIMRPFDFTIVGKVDTQNILRYYTMQGKSLGSITIQRVARTGFIKHLKLLGINDEIVLFCKEAELLAKLAQCVDVQLCLRVMPASLYTHLMRKQSKEKVKDSLQLSPRIL